MWKKPITIALAVLTAGWLVACAQEPGAEGGTTVESGEAPAAAEETAEPSTETAVEPTITGTEEVIVAHGEEIAFEPGPPSLPAGAEFAVLEGDPAEAEPLTFRLRFPAGYEIPPHWHHVLEHVTVLEGTLNLGLGETMDRDRGTALDPGDFYVIPVEETHYAWTGDEPVEIQLHSVGPWGITYVNPEDDPRNASETTGDD